MVDVASTDRAAALFHTLDALKTERPQTPRVFERVMARGCDLGIVIVAAFLLLTVCFVLQAIVWGNRDIEQIRNPGRGEIAFTVMIPVILGGLVVWNEVLGFGSGRQTLGKRALGLQVTLLDGRTPGPTRMAGRWLTECLSLVTILAAWSLIAVRVSSGAGFAIMIAVVALASLLLVGRGGRGVHDRIWGTRVVRPR